MPDLSGADRILSVISTQVEKSVKSGANIEMTYGQVFGLDDGYRSSLSILAGGIGSTLGPQGYWRLNEARDTVAVDITGLGNVGAYVGSPILASVLGPLPNDPQYVAAFNGTSQYVSVTDTVGLTQSADLSISAWVQRKVPGAYHGIISKGDSGYYLRIDANNKIVFIKGGVAVLVSSTATITDTAWHHIVFVRVNDVANSRFPMQIYLDGVDVTDTATMDTTTALATPAGTPVFIGAQKSGSSPTEFFNGSIAEVVLYGGALTPAEAAIAYESRTEFPGSASVYLAGSRELATSDGGTAFPSGGFRVPSYLKVDPNDFVRVSMDERGHRWVEDLIIPTSYPKMYIDPIDGVILTGDGNSAPSVPSPDSYPTRAQYNITGGGTVSWDSSYNLSWTVRFITISQGRGSAIATSGYFDIGQPANGTAILGYGGAVNRNWSASGILINAWEALYYVLPNGSANATVPANFRIVAYTSDFIVPSNWVLLAIHNGDMGRLYVANRMVLRAGRSWDASLDLPNILGPVTTTTGIDATRSLTVDSGAGSNNTKIILDVAGTGRGLLRATSAGNVVLTGSGTGGTYLSWESGSGGVHFGNGSGTEVFGVDSSGSLRWNISGPDLWNNSNTLRTSYSFMVDGLLTAASTIKNSNGQFYSDSSMNFTTVGGGTAQKARFLGIYVGTNYGEPAGPNEGIQFGGNVNLYRYTTDVLKTDDLLWAVSGLKITSPSNADGQNFAAVKIILPNSGFAGIEIYQNATDTQPVYKNTGGANILMGLGGSTAPVQVVGVRRTGWTAATGTATRTSFASDTVSLINLGRAVKALIDDLIAHGLIGT